MRFSATDNIFIDYSTDMGVL